MKHLLLFAASVSIVSCTLKQPYEDVLVRHFEQNAKVVPIIEMVTVDSVIDIAAYHEHHSRISSKLKQSTKEFIERDIASIKESIEEWIKLNKRLSVDLSKDLVDRDKQVLAKRQRELANLDSVYKADPVIMNYVRLSESSGEYSRAVVKYQLSKDGVTSIATFVISPDSVVYPIGNDSFDRFIKVTLPQLRPRNQR